MVKLPLPAVWKCVECAGRPLRALLGDGLVTSEGLLHDVHKRLMKPAFNIRPITSKYRLMAELVIRDIKLGLFL